MFAQIDSDGNIVATYTREQDFSQDGFAGFTQVEMPDDDPAILEFFAKLTAAPARPSIEDVISVLSSDQKAALQSITSRKVGHG